MLVAQRSLRRLVARLRSKSFASLSQDRLAVLCILDGWGYRETAEDNAVILGNTPNFDTLYGVHSQRGQVGFLDACEREVGLPVGQIGNSEVGHMNIGAGRIVYQEREGASDGIGQADVAMGAERLGIQPQQADHRREDRVEHQMRDVRVDVRPNVHG